MKNIVFAILTCATISSNAEPIYLATYSEMIESNSNKSLFQPKLAPVPGAPNIEIVIPKIDVAVGSPTPIRLKFESKSPSVIKPETFKIFYGNFQIDVTERLLRAAKVDPSGFYVQEAALPKGSHKITLNVQDSEGRMGSKTIEFEIK